MGFDLSRSWTSCMMRPEGQLAFTLATGFRFDCFRNEHGVSNYSHNANLSFLGIVVLSTYLRDLEVYLR
ncbi:hypothetical protein CEXT_559521 [Caerostris extrusa]|uniref:Uncharacterized protein n=1 Tax=Caerostris extrusa TaxID=172846 RepID=A0AAV4V5C6_CAEEX|nr:hypothetical protein CEXT_559521 [Caerostris extrusa]